MSGIAAPGNSHTVSPFCSIFDPVPKKLLSVLKSRLAEFLDSVLGHVAARLLMVLCSGCFGSSKIPAIDLRVEASGIKLSGSSLEALSNRSFSWTRCLVSRILYSPLAVDKFIKIVEYTLANQARNTK